MSDDQIGLANAFAEKHMPDVCKPKFKVVDDGPSALARIDLGQQTSQIAREVGQVLKDAPFFYFGEGYVTVDEGTGQLEAVAPIDFCTWVEEFVVFYRWRSKDDPEHVVSIAKDLAGRILASRQLRSFIRPLKAVNEARLPVFREGRIELLPLGYDKATLVYTAPVVEYDYSLDLEDAKGFLCEVFKEFPWFEQEGALFAKRSFVAQIAATLGPYCRLMLPESASEPMVVWVGNQPGCGKSLLMRMALAPIYGACEESSKPKSEEELRKLLDTVAITRKPYLVLDDVPFLSSNELNQFVTSPILSCRVLGQSKVVTCPNICQVFATGNQLKLTFDLERRALVVDLFDPARSIDRSITNPITAHWLWHKETRARFLAVLWAFVRHWADEGQPMHSEAVKKSFEPFTQLIGSICIAAGMVNPFGIRENESGGDEEGRALEILLAAMVGETEESKQRFTAKEIAEQADSRGFLDTIFPYAVKDESKALGQRLKKLRGRQLRDSRGRAYEFGKRRVESGSVYEITLLDEQRLDDPF